MRSFFVVLASAIAACTTVLAQGTATMRTHSISMPYIGNKPSSLVLAVHIKRLPL